METKLGPIFSPIGTGYNSRGNNPGFSGYYFGSGSLQESASYRWNLACNGMCPRQCAYVCPL